MGKVREIVTAPSQEDACAYFKVLAQEDGPLTRHLWPEIKKRIQYLDSPEKAVPFTTSRMERAVRRYRRRTKPMNGFKADQGTENFSHRIL